MQTRVAVGAGVVGAVLVLARLAPGIVGGVLLLFSALVFVLSIVGLARTVVLPGRMSPAWGFAIAFGLYLGGVAFIAPLPEVVRSDGSTAAGARKPDSVEPSPNDSERPGFGESFVQASTWTDGPWPLVVDSGTLACFEVGGQEAAFIAAGYGIWDQQMWPLNGVARMHHERFGAEPALDPIWAPNPVTGLRVNIGPMIARARLQCR